MRPPQNAGENKEGSARQGRRNRGFNEAPAKRGGKLARIRSSASQLDRFNEAPAKRGGKPTD